MGASGSQNSVVSIIPSIIVTLKKISLHQGKEVPGGKVDAVAGRRQTRRLNIHHELSVTCPRSHRQQMAESTLNSNPSYIETQD